MILTVAIPSFNRAEAAEDAVVRLASVLEDSGIPILLANNGSVEDSYQRVEAELSKIPHAEYLKFVDNKGFALNLLRLLSNAKTKYVLVLSDEDDISEDLMDSLTNFLLINEPALVTLRPGSRYSSKLKVKKLKGETSYISGIIFNLDLVRAILPNMEILVEDEEFAYLYPQVLLAAYLRSKGDSFILSKPSVSNRINLPTTVTGKSGSEYWLPTERVYQYLSLMRCLDAICLWLNESEMKELERFRNMNRANFFGMIFDSVKTISPQILGDLTRSSFKTSAKFELKKLVSKIKI